MCFFKGNVTFKNKKNSPPVHVERTFQFMSKLRSADIMPLKLYIR